MLNFDWLIWITPGQARWIILGMYLAILAAIWRIPNSYLFQGAPNQKIWRNLKFWAALAIASQLFVYAYF